MKRYIALLVAFALLTACSSNNQERAVSTNEAIEISVLYNEKAENPYSKDWLIVSEYYSRQNVSLNVFCGDDENYSEAIDSYLTSGNPPDIILKCHPGELNEYINMGLVLPVSDYMDQMPYFNEYMTKNNLWDEVDKLRHPNGKFYILPGYQRKNQVQQWIYRKDIFDKNGLNAPTTYDEMFDSLIELRAIYGDSACITASWGGAHLFSMMGPGYNIPAGWSGTRAYDREEDEWFFAPASDNYREMLRFLNKCYEEGILDPDIFTQTNEEFTNKMLNNEAFISVTWVSSGFDNWNKTLEENGFKNADWSPLKVPESTMGISKLPAITQFYKGLAISSAAADKPYFEKLMEFIDWAVYSEEGITLTNWGVQGITYEILEGKKVLNENIIFPTNPSATIHMVREYGMNTMLNLNENHEFEDAKKPQEIVAFLEKSMKNNETAEAYPAINMTLNETEVETTIMENLNDYITQAQMAFIKGEHDIEADWNDHVKELEERGYKLLEDIWNKAWKRDF